MMGLNVIGKGGIKSGGLILSGGQMGQYPEDGLILRGWAYNQRMGLYSEGGPIIRGWAYTQRVFFLIRG